MGALCISGGAMTSEQRVRSMLDLGATVLCLTALSALAFGLFWLLQVAIIARGIEGIKILGSYAAPFLLTGGILLLLWGIRHGGGLGHILTESQRLQGKTQNVSFWKLFPPALTAIAFPSTSTLIFPVVTNIPSGNSCCSSRCA